VNGRAEKDDSDVIRKKEGYKQMNLLEFKYLMTCANMPRCLQRGALFD